MSPIDSLVGGDEMTLTMTIRPAKHVQETELWAYDEAVNGQLKRMECQEAELDDFLDLQAQQTQRAILDYAALRETVEIDKARRRARKEDLVALKNKVGIVTQLGAPHILDPVPLLAANPSIEACRIGVTNGSGGLHGREVGSDNGDSGFGPHLVELANAINQKGDVQRNPETRPRSIARPPATLSDVHAYEALNMAYVSKNPSTAKERTSTRSTFYPRSKNLVQARNTESAPTQISKARTKGGKTSRERWDHRQAMRALAGRLEMQDRAAGESVDPRKVAEILKKLLHHKMVESDEGSDGGNHEGGGAEITDHGESAEPTYQFDGLAFRTK